MGCYLVSNRDHQHYFFITFFYYYIYYYHSVFLPSLHPHIHILLFIYLLSFITIILLLACYTAAHPFTYTKKKISDENYNKIYDMK